MALTDAHKQLLKESWAGVKANTGDDLGDLGTKMFVRLFTESPEVIPIFPFATGDIEKIKVSPRVRKHGKSVMGMVDAAIAGLDDMDALAAVLTELGKRHKNYKATPAHFTPVGGALLWTLEDTAGDAFTPEVKEAWVTVYGVITAVMSAELS